MRVRPLVVLLGALAIVFAGLAVPANAKPKKGAAPYYLGYHAPSPGSTPREGVVLTLHGGGWRGDLGPDADKVMRPYIEDLNEWGYTVYNLGYRSGSKSLRDTLDAVRKIDRAFGDRPLCVLGGSAGGHLALMAAAKLPNAVDCVIDIAGPPNLVKPDSAPFSHAVPKVARQVFGKKRAKKLSPMKRRNQIKAPVLVVAPECDYFTSPRRQLRFAERLPLGQILIEAAQPDLSEPKGFFGRLFGLLRPRGVETGHCKVTNRAFEEFRAAQFHFLAANLG